MRMFFIAYSELELGYTPDWIRIEFKNPEDSSETITLTMDISGEISYFSKNLDVFVKGELVPWVYSSSANDDRDFGQGELSKEETEFYLDMFNKNLPNAESITVGVTPIMEEEKYCKFIEKKGTEDSFSWCKGGYIYTEKEGNSFVEKEEALSYSCEINI